MKKISLMLLAMFATASFAQKSVSITVKNPSSDARPYTPVELSLEGYGEVTRAIVTCDGEEIPCQLDDLDMNEHADALFFLADLKGKQSKTYTVTLSDEGRQPSYKPLVYAEMMLINRSIKDKTKQDAHISSLTVDGWWDYFHALHHHGPAFESELVAYRIYFDNRQSVDTYGKQHRGLELKDTQFSTTPEMRTEGYGEDVLWGSNSLCCGSLRGWDGQKPLMLDSMPNRTERVLARGPLRTIVEVIDHQWRMLPDSRPVTMATRYTLCGGHRDVQVEARFSRAVPDLQFATGTINVKNSTEYSDHKGLRGCWGTDWAVGAKDTLKNGNKPETVGLATYVPRKYMVSEQPANPVDYVTVISTAGTDRLAYSLTFGSANEDFGYHSAAEWFAYLKAWKKELDTPAVITVK